MLRFLTISRHERVAVIRDGQYVSLLEPGRRWIFTWPGLVETVRFDVRQLVYGIDESDVLPAAMPGTEVVHVLPSERVVVRVDGVVLRVLTAGRYRLWDASGRVELLRYDAWVTPVALADTDRLEPAVTSAWTELVATDAAALVLRRDGDPVRALPAGRYRVWAGGPWSLERVWLGLIPLEMAAQDLVTGDEVPVRIKPAAVLRVVDPVRHLGEEQGLTHAYGAVQLALREVLASRTLDGLVSDRDGLSKALTERARVHLPEVGYALELAFVKDVILSAEVKDLVGRVTLARKEAEALSIRRREEVAATRQLANTAKLLASSPVLMRLKELEAMSEMVGKIDKLVVVGGPELTRQIALRELDS